MAKRFVRISLGTKLRLLFGAAVIGIIAVGLLVPWYFMELVAEQGLQRPAEELTRLRLSEWTRYHPDPEKAALARDETSEVVSLYAEGHRGAGLRGPSFIHLRADGAGEAADSPATQQALEVFRRHPQRDVVLISTQDETLGTVYRGIRAVRADDHCIRCHDQSKPLDLQFEPGQLVGLIDVSLPAQGPTEALVIWTRLAFLAGGLLAVLAAFSLLPVITRKLILQPIGHLRDTADRVAEGDLGVRCTLDTGDELQRLGDSYNEMLEAITEQTSKLRSANRALDIKLSELAEANVTLHRANQVKSEFLANVSHELRTPLNSIIGFADLLSEAPEERHQRWGRNISVAAKNLMNMINDLLDLARIEAGRAEVRFDKVSIADICQTLVALMRPLADKKQIDLTLELPAHLPMAMTDGGKVQQILYNLLSNAVKFTPVGGEVMIRASMPTPPAGEDSGEVAVAVRDTGPGIPESDQQQIFEKFYQADRTLTREAGGTGLGLAISRELAHLLGGRVTLQSTPGHGATFTLLLPLRPANWRA